MKPKEIISKLIFDRFHEKDNFEVWDYESNYDLIKTAEYYGLIDLANEMRRDMKI